MTIDELESGDNEQQRCNGTVAWAMIAAFVALAIMAALLGPLVVASLRLIGALR